MQATQITLRNVKHSTYVARRIRDKCDQLERFHPHILHCRVAIEQPSRRTAALRPCVVTIRVGIPGREIVVSGAGPHGEMHTALRDAFAAARRELKDAASVQRGDVKSHTLPATEAA